MAVIEVGTNSYVTEAELTTYATDRGITISGSIDVLLIKAMDYIETRNFIGQKTVSTQTLQFPREVCSGIDGCEIDSTIVPEGIKNAQMIASLIIDGGNDLQPSIERTVKKEKVDAIEVEYMDNALSSKQYVSLNDALRPFIRSGVTAVRR